MKRFLPVVAVLLALLLASTAGAGEPEKKQRLHDTGELAVVNTTGNTEVLTVSAKNKLSYDFTDKDKGTWKVFALYGKDDGVKNAESYSTDLRYDHSFTERFYAFGLTGWAQDKFKGIDNRYFGGAGCGYRLVDTEKQTLSTELGVNYTHEAYTDDTSDDFAEGRAFADYVFRFTEKNRFTQSVEFLYNFRDSERYKVNSETAVIAALTDIFSLKASYTVNYDHAPVPATLDQTDTRLALALVVDY